MEPVTRVRPVGCTFSMLVPSRHRENYEGAAGYEAYSSVLFRASCASSDVVIDIGAHMGYFSLLAHQANPSARVIAVEASPDNHEVLAQNLEPAGERVSSVNAAFGDVQGTVTLQLTEASDNCGTHGNPMSPTLATVDVPAITSKDLDVPSGSRLTIKIDVEGGEVSVLDGLEPLLASGVDNRLLIELNPPCLYRAESSPEELLNWLFDHRYRVFLLDEDRRDWAEVRTAGGWTAHLGPPEYANLFCLPAERALTVSAIMHHAGIAGVERTHVELVEELVRRGAMVHTVVPLPDSMGLGGELARAGSSVSPVEPYPWWMSPGGNPGDAAHWQSGLLDSGVIGAVAGVRPDVVLTQTGAVPQGAVAAAVLGIPHVWFLHEFGDLDHGLQLPVSPIEFGSVVRELSAAVVTNSAGVRGHFFGDNHDGVTVIHPFPRLEAADTPEPVDRPSTVGVVASLNPGKGHEDVLQAVAALRATGLDVPVVCVGPGEPEDQMRLRDVAQQLGVADLLSLHGPVRERRELYGLFDIVAVPSRAEAFGRVPFEATAAGLPVVYRDSCGPAGYMTAGVTGLGYAAGEIDELVAALRSLVEDRSLGRRLVAAARAQLGDPARHEAYGEAVIAVLRQAATRPVDGSIQLLIRWMSTAVAAARAEREGLADPRDNETRPAEAISRLWQDRAALQAEHERVNLAFAELWQDRAALQAEHERVNLAYAELWQDRAALQAEHERVNLAYAELRQDRATRQAEYDRVNLAYAELRQDREAVRAASFVADQQSKAELARLAAEHQVLEEEHRRVVQSRVWRFSRPVRQLRGNLRRRA